MTDSPSSDRDELVAAYLDGEATPAERAIVEGDDALMERVAILSQVVSMVSEPVAPAPPEQRRAHIAAALDASATAPNVTSMSAKRKRRFSASQLAAAAAAAVAVIAIPVVVSQTGDDTQTAFEKVSSDLSSGDDSSVAAADGVTLSEAAEEPADEPAEEEASFSDDGAGDDGGEAITEDEAAEIEAQPAEEPANALEEEATADDDTGAGFPSLPRLDVELAPDVDSLVSQILPPPDGARQSAPALDDVSGLICIETIMDTAAGDLIVVTGSTVLDNELVEYVVTERNIAGQPTLELTIFGQTCEPIFTDTVSG